MADPTGGSRQRHQARKERVRGSYGSNPAKPADSPPGVIERGRRAIQGAVDAVKGAVSDASSEYDQFKAGVKKVRDAIPGMED